MHRRLTRSLVSVSAGVALTVGTVGSATAAPPDADEYYLDGFQTETPGTGSATADTDVDRTFNFRAAAAVTGGTKTLIPILNLFPYSKRSEAIARTLASGAVDGLTSPGSFAVTVTLDNVTSRTSRTGNGHARVEAFAQVTYQTGLEQFAVAGQGTVNSPQDGTVVIEFDVEVPAGATPGIQIELRAFADATATGNAASSEISGRLRDVTATPIT